MSAPKDWQSQADEWAAEAVASGRPTAWFERLYAAGRDGAVTMPWDHDAPHPVLADWLASSRRPTSGRAAVVGCGLGADAEALTAIGFETVGFDLSESAIAEARARHPGSRVSYVVGDLLDSPPEWQHGFDLVVEIYTVQAVPESMRAPMTAAVADLVAAGGTLLAIQMVRGDGAAVDGPPWPLTRSEMAAFAHGGLEQASFAPVEHPARPGLQLWVGEFARASSD